MLLPMSYFNNKKAIKYAFITTFASVIGGVLGYLIGIFINKEIIPPKLVIGTVISEMTFYKVRDLYRENVFLAIFVSALTPIPYKAFTIAGGYFQVALLPFILGSFLGRGMRFFSEALLFYVFGPTIKPFVDKNFEKLTILIALLIILFFAILKWIS
jgi:undecaprenyl-diphosphatase